MVSALYYTVIYVNEKKQVMYIELLIRGHYVIIWCNGNAGSTYLFYELRKVEYESQSHRLLLHQSTQQMIFCQYPHNAKTML